ncbi:phenylalanine--tRNA ligase subunit beta [Prosthecochloris sp.]|uniref:phenylalanine--tRNA ligase subunit beta n=1 Tax=Prosthecochloris sp. TaxID=290513 RepID=UPI0025D51101|nr:phenylalanine--tRNA ligase subunit beta [Prosthecochloris sp.]
MKISVDWLKDFVPSITSDIPSLVDQLTFLGLEVEDIITKKLPDSLVVVGKVEEVGQHPNADRLKICRVDVGGVEPLQIVCGASNVAEGQLVPVAMIGAKLETPEGENFSIKKSKIRGERSFGMICAADELGLSDDHSGIMVLEEHFEIGRPVASYLHADTVLDIAVTPNRPDVLSHLGVAREIVGTAQVALPDICTVDFTSSENLVKIKDPDACPYYSGIVIRNVVVKESPSWLKQKIESIGLRPRNNIVDITNYVLHALGQPLHAFDLLKLKGKSVEVRTDMSGSIVAINQESYELKPGMPVICDKEVPVAIAGIMGGYDSAVSDSTTDILLESAYFSPGVVRKASKILGLTSDSAYRFERGTDPGNVRFAAQFAVKLILELAGGGITEAEEAGSILPERKAVALRPERANEILGCSISMEKMVSMLENIGFIMTANDKDEYLVFSVPTFRVDVEQEIDLIEEIARLEGYNNIAASERMVASYPQSRKNPEYFPDYLRSVMIGLQFREILTNPLITKRDALQFDQHSVPVLNPISEGLEVLRPSLVPTMLKVISHNIKHGIRDMRLFEVGHSFFALNEDGDTAKSMTEKEQLVFAVTGSRYPVNWDRKKEQVDFFDMKGAVEMLFGKLNLLDKSSLNIYNESTLSITCDWKGEDKPLKLHAGKVQQIAPEVLEAFDIDQQVFVAEIDTQVLERCFTLNVRYEPPSRYPVVERDLSFILPEGLEVQKLVDCVKTSDILISSVRVFDLFEREPENNAGKVDRSVALSLNITDHSGTLKEENVKKILQKVMENAESRLGAVIRQV